MKVGDLVRWTSMINGERTIGIFLGKVTEVSPLSHVWVEGKRLSFLTRELEVVQ